MGTIPMPSTGCRGTLTSLHYFSTSIEPPICIGSCSIFLIPPMKLTIYFLGGDQISFFHLISQRKHSKEATGTENVAITAKRLPILIQQEGLMKPISFTPTGDEMPHTGLSSSAAPSSPGR